MIGNKTQMFGVSAKSRPFYMAIGIVMGVITVSGFWPTYFGPLIAATLTQPPIIHWHALVFGGWLALFFAQAAFAAAGCISLHMCVGRIGIVYGICLIAVGLTTGVIRAGALESAGLLMGVTLDMLGFALFLGLAISFRSKPQIHKRAMIVAATALLIAAVSRLWFLPELPMVARIPAFFLIWFLPILCAIAYDLAHDKRVHPIYILGIVILAIRAIMQDPLAQTDTWLRFADGIFDLWNVSTSR
jgi:hypothetical protein